MNPTSARSTAAKPSAHPSVRTVKTCAVCGERLSSYNPGPNCYAHTVDLPWKGPAHRP